MPIYKSETEKIRPIVLKYIHGEVIDLGCGPDLIVPNAFGVDARKLPTVQFVTKKVEQIAGENRFRRRFGTVFSSHCLEHLRDDMAALSNWCYLLKQEESSRLILYLPDDRYYDNSKNPEHLQIYTFESFLDKVSKGVESLSFVDGGMHTDVECYSFWSVWKLSEKFLNS